MDRRPPRAPLLRDWAAGLRAPSALRVWGPGRGGVCGLQPAGGTRDRGLEGPRLRLRCCLAIQPPAPDRLSQDSHPSPPSHTCSRTFSTGNFLMCVRVFASTPSCSRSQVLSVRLFPSQVHWDTQAAPPQPTSASRFPQTAKQRWPPLLPACCPCGCPSCLVGALVSSLLPRWARTLFVPSVCSSPLTGWRANHRVPGTMSPLGPPNGPVG